MSASSKKKLRSAEEAAKLTERQQKEQKEAKKLKAYSTAFVVVIALMVVFAAYTGITSAISSSGTRERNTVAMTVGEHEISSAEVSFYYINAVNSFYSSYGSYAALIGMDVSKPLNEQVVSEETGATWADDFLESAKSSIQSVYALADAAQAAGFTLSDEEQAAIDASMGDMTYYAVAYGYSNLEDYIKAMYGNGASEKLVREWYERISLAEAYQTHYSNELTYEDADLRSGEAEAPEQYNSYSYNVYTLYTSDFQEGGTEDEEGNVTYSDEEKAAAVEAAEAIAQELAAGGYTTAAELDAAIAALPMNAEETDAASIEYVDKLYSSVSSVIRDWVSSSDRKAGDLTYISNATTTTAEDGTETTSTPTAFNVVLFNDVTDNAFPMDNVRHILAAFEGGTQDESGNTTYSDTEKAAAEAKANELLNTWKNGDATEESFMELAKTESADTGSAADGGLIANIYPDSSLVENFLNWSIDESRKAGDTGIVESIYGYHVMYYSGEAEQTYRDYMIETDLRTADVNAWVDALLEATPAAVVDTTYIPMDLVLSAA